MIAPGWFKKWNCTVDEENAASITQRKQYNEGVKAVKTFGEQRERMTGK
jgi:hypothetical protein